MDDKFWLFIHHFFLHHSFSVIHLYCRTIQKTKAPLLVISFVNFIVPIKHDATNPVNNNNSSYKLQQQRQQIITVKNAIGANELFFHRWITFKSINWLILYNIGEFATMLLWTPCETNDADDAFFKTKFYEFFYCHHCNYYFLIFGFIYIRTPFCFGYYFWKYLHKLLFSFLPFFLFAFDFLNRSWVFQKRLKKNLKSPNKHWKGTFMLFNFDLLENMGRHFFEFRTTIWHEIVFCLSDCVFIFSL